MQQEGVRGEGITDPHPWRGDGVRTRSRNLEGMMEDGDGVLYVIRRKGGTRTASSFVG